MYLLVGNEHAVSITGKRGMGKEEMPDEPSDKVCVLPEDPVHLTTKLAARVSFQEEVLAFNLKTSDGTGSWFIAFATCIMLTHARTQVRSTV